MSAFDDEARLRAEIIARLEVEGWTVSIEPQFDDQDGALRADLLATRPGETILVEIESRPGPIAQPSRLARFADAHGYGFRLYASTPPGAATWWRSRLADFAPVPDTRELRERLVQARELASQRGLADVGLFTAYAATAYAMMRVERQLGFRDDVSLLDDLERFDDGAQLVSHGRIGQGDHAVMRLARELLDRAGPETEPGGSAAEAFDADVAQLLERLIALGFDVAVLIDTQTP